MEPLIDGLNDQSGGMDASRTPEVIAERNYAAGVNVVARDGMVRTRPMFRRVEMDLPPAAIRTSFFQGSLAYYNPATGASLLLAVFSGRVYSINPLTRLWLDLSAAAGLVNDSTATHYFCLAESFMLISDGVDGTLIFDGATLRRAGEDEIPACSIMAYGQGRIFFFSPDFRSIGAGDLVYGGSIASIAILTSQKAGLLTKVTTAKEHKFETGDTVTIERHYSSPSIIGTWSVTVTSPTSFTIPVELISGSRDGAVQRSVEGEEADVLRYTEHRFQNEKGIFRLPAWMGKGTALTFFPVQDTGTGQGDLLAAGENGACSFLVSEPRDTWLNIQIQRVALTEIGFGGHLGLTHVNGDIFFTSFDGLRSYRNARAEFGQYGNTPLSSEIRPFLPSLGLPVFENSSMGVFDNRLLFTASPRVLPTTEPAIPPRCIFQSIAALDFQQSSRISKSGLAAYDGIWTGLDVQQLVPAHFGSDKRLYAWCWQRQADDSYGPRENELWEITTRDTGYDSFVECGTGEQRVRIAASVELRAFDFESWKQEKRLTRLDMWVDEMRGALVSLGVYWRPNIHSGGWFYWGAPPSGGFSPSECAYTQPISAGPCASQSQVRPAFHVSPFSLGTPPVYDDPITKRRAERGFTFQVRLDWAGRMRLKKLLAYAELLTEPTQGDNAARQIEDVSTFPEWPRQMPPIGSPFSYSLLSPPACKYRPCVTFDSLRTTGPDDYQLLFTVDEDGPPEIQFAAGAIEVARSTPPGAYLVALDNGFATANIIVTPLTPDDPEWPDGPAVRVKITPDGTDPGASFTALLEVDSCFAQPLAIVLGTNFGPTPP